MKLLKTFSNELGKAELIQFDDCYATTIHSERAQISNFTEHKDKQSAIENFQFHCAWLVHNK